MNAKKKEESKAKAETKRTQPNRAVRERNTSTRALFLGQSFITHKMGDNADQRMIHRGRKEGQGKEGASLRRYDMAWWTMMDVYRGLVGLVCLHLQSEKERGWVRCLSLVVYMHMHAAGAGQ